MPRTVRKAMISRSEFLKSSVSNSVMLTLNPPYITASPIKVNNNREEKNNFTMEILFRIVYNHNQEYDKRRD